MATPYGANSGPVKFLDLLPDLSECTRHKEPVTPLSRPLLEIWTAYSLPWWPNARLVTFVRPEAKTVAR